MIKRSDFLTVKDSPATLQGVETLVRLVGWFIGLRWYKFWAAILFLNACVVLGFALVYQYLHDPGANDVHFKHTSTEFFPNYIEKRRNFEEAFVAEVRDQLEITGPFKLSLQFQFKEHHFRLVDVVGFGSHLTKFGGNSRVSISLQEKVQSGLPVRFGNCLSSLSGILCVEEPIFLMLLPGGLGRADEHLTSAFTEYASIMDGMSEFSAEYFWAQMVWLSLRAGVYGMFMESPSPVTLKAWLIVSFQNFVGFLT